MREQAGSEGGRVAMIGPERGVDLMSAVVVDKGSYLVDPLREIRRRLQIKHRDDLLHICICSRCNPSLVEPIGGNSDRSPKRGDTCDSHKNAFDNLDSS